MGVLVCSRSDCENVMCDRYSPAYGYLCDECFAELVRCGVKTDIDEFLSRAVHTDDDPAAIESYFGVIFPRTDS